MKVQHFYILHDKTIQKNRQIIALKINCTKYIVECVQIDNARMICSCRVLGGVTL